MSAEKNVLNSYFSNRMQGNGGGGRGTTSHYAQLNRRILDCGSTGELCELIEADAEEFDVVNVGTAFRKLLQSRRNDVPRGVMKQALQALKAAALRTIDVFGPQELVNKDLGPGGGGGGQAEASGGRAGDEFAGNDSGDQNGKEDMIDADCDFEFDFDLMGIGVTAAARGPLLHIVEASEQERLDAELARELAESEGARQPGHPPAAKDGARLRPKDAAGESSNSKLCGNCCKALQKPLVCARCKTATYCSKDCQIKAWRAGHKGECALEGRAQGRVAAGTRKKPLPNSEQLRVFAKLNQLADAGDSRGLAAQERQARAVAAAVRTSRPSAVSWVYCTLGNAFQSLGNISKAIEYHTEHLTIAKEVGDRAGEGAAYGNLGNAYQLQGDFSKAIEYQKKLLAITKEVGNRAEEGRAYGKLGCAYEALWASAKAIVYHKKNLAIAKEVGDRPGEGMALGNLASAYDSQGDFFKAIEYHTQCLAIQKEVGDRAGEGAVYGNIGNVYQSQGDYSKATEYHTQRLAIAKELGDRSGEGVAYGNLGNAYESQGDISKAMEYHAQHLAIAKETGDRSGEGRALGNLGACHVLLDEYEKAVAYFKAQQAIAISLKLAHMQSHAALNMGVALTLHVRAARQGTAAGADHAHGPHSHSSASSCLNDTVREAAKWLQAALDGGQPFASLHLAHLSFDAGQEDAALAYLKEHLSWRVLSGRYLCAGCGQTRGEDTPMLTCSGCRVARFCSADHQKMASKKAALGGNLKKGLHKDVCGVLGRWREVVKDGVAPDSCTAELLAFLQRMNAKPSFGDHH